MLLLVMYKFPMGSYLEMSSDFYNGTLLTYQPKHEIELDVSLMYETMALLSMVTN